MKSTRTVLAVAIVVAGFAYFDSATTANPPTIGPATQCCSPQPEDIRAYGVLMTGKEEGVPFLDIIIPRVEGRNGFILTLARAIGGMEVYQDTGEGPELIFRTANSVPLNLTNRAGFPLVVGSTISVFGAPNEIATIIGYVY